jgi:Co/Zn/Cd efflux system component
MHLCIAKKSNAGWGALANPNFHPAYIFNRYTIFIATQFFHQITFVTRLLLLSDYGVIMGANCCHHDQDHDPANSPDPKYRRILWIALIINALMFVVEIIFSARANSVSLLADSIDFLGDSANYGISIWVLAMSVQTRAKASLLKAASMGIFGVAVLAHALWNAISGVVPDAQTMTLIGFLALAANVSVAIMLYAYRNGDSNMRSVWLCTRNDALGNIAVVLAAVGVFGTGTNWPDLIVAAIMASLALTSSFHVVKQARHELQP